MFKNMGKVFKMNDDAVRDVRFSGLKKAIKDKLYECLEVFVCLAENYTGLLLSAACGVADVVLELRRFLIKKRSSVCKRR